MPGWRCWKEEYTQNILLDIIFSSIIFSVFKKIFKKNYYSFFKIICDLRRVWIRRRRAYLPFVSSHRNLSKEYTRVPRSSRMARVYSRAGAGTYVAYVRRLGTYLRQLLWYMEVAPKFPQGVVRLLAALSSLSLFLSRQPSVFSPRLSLLFRLSRSLLSDLLPLLLQPTISRSRERSRVHLADVFPHSAVILARSPHSRAESTWNYQDCGPRRRC